MIQTKYPQIDTKTLMARIREEMAKSQDERAAMGHNIFDEEKTGESFNLPLINQYLGQAEKNAGVGIEMPPMTHFNPAIRWLAVLAARAVLYLTQLITVPQRQFNQSIVDGLRETVEGLGDLNQQLMLLEKKISEVERGMESQEQRINYLYEQTTKNTELPFEQERSEAPTDE
jgi:hypothetical protein